MKERKWLYLKAFIQATKDGFPKSHNFYIANQGFQEMGFETCLFSTLDEITECRPDDLIVGGIGVVRGKMAEFGIELPKIDYPEELKAYLGRRVWHTTIDQILSDPFQRPVFVKPIREKRFTGIVLRKESDCPQLSYCEEHEPVYCSEAVDFQREWRAFIRYGKILDVRPYYGDWKKRYDPAVIERAVADYVSDPAGYAMDFGVTADGRTLLVEVNDGYSLGCYGLAAVEYARLLSARWCELTGIHDECDVYMEKYEWMRKSRNLHG